MAFNTMSVSIGEATGPKGGRVVQQPHPRRHRLLRARPTPWSRLPLPVRSRHANRPQHCSEDVLGNWY